jgi:hypothetical protein
MVLASRSSHALDAKAIDAVLLRGEADGSGLLTD